MAIDLDLAPFLPELAVFVDQKSTSFDPHEFSAIERFFSNYVELSAELLVRIRQQVEWKLLLCLEFFVRGNAVPRNAEDDGFLPSEPGVQLAKVPPFCCAAWRRVLWIEVNHHFAATQGFQLNGLVTGGFGFKVFDDSIEYWSGHFVASVCPKSGFDGFENGIKVELFAKVMKIVTQLRDRG